MARILGTATLLPNGVNEQSVNLGFTPTWATITVTGTGSYGARSEGKATASYSHCQFSGDGKRTNESGYLVRFYDNTSTLVASAKFKSFASGHLNLKDISVTGTHQMLIEAGN